MIAGNAPENRLTRLHRFWMQNTAVSPLAFHDSPIRHAQNWLSVLRGRVLGAPGHFRPRWDAYSLQGFSSFYSLRPTRVQLQQLVDFARLNDSPLRVSIATTDIETGKLVIFDSRSERIGIDHLLASCGYLPEFAPVQIGERVLGDGGLSANAPLEAVLDEPGGPRIILVVEF